MRAKCKTCGRTTSVSIDADGSRPAFTCSACGAEHAEVRANLFSITGVLDDDARAELDARVEPAQDEPTIRAPLPPPQAHDPDAAQDSYRRDLLILAEQTRLSMLPPPPVCDVQLDAPPSVRAAIRISATLIRPPVPVIVREPPAVAAVELPVPQHPDPLHPRTMRSIAAACAFVAGCVALGVIVSLSSPSPPKAEEQARAAGAESAPRGGCGVASPGSDAPAVPLPAEATPVTPAAPAPPAVSTKRFNARPFTTAPKADAKDPPPAVSAEPRAPIDLKQEMENSVQGRRPPTAPAPETAPLPTTVQFDRGAALGVLQGIANGVAWCKQGGAGGRGGVTVTFAPTGVATAVLLDAGPFAGTPVGECITSQFRAARVPPFSGAPVTLHRSFVVN